MFCLQPSCQQSLGTFGLISQEFKVTRRTVGGAGAHRKSPERKGVEWGESPPPLFKDMLHPSFRNKRKQILPGSLSLRLATLPKFEPFAAATARISPGREAQAAPSSGLAALNLVSFVRPALK